MVFRIQPCEQVSLSEHRRQNVDKDVPIAFSTSNHGVVDADKSPIPIYRDVAKNKDSTSLSGNVGFRWPCTGLSEGYAADARMG